MVHHAKSLGKINCHDQCVDSGIGLIEALGYIMCKNLESGYGGVVGTDAMLVW